jgi:hypothetical protein
VPPLDLGLREGGGARRQAEGQSAEEGLLHHSNLSHVIPSGTFLSFITPALRPDDVSMTKT